MRGDVVVFLVVLELQWITKTSTQETFSGSRFGGGVQKPRSFEISVENSNTR